MAKKPSKDLSPEELGQVVGAVATAHGHDGAAMAKSITNKVVALMEGAKYDLEHPPQYKSPDSSNVYTVIARRKVEQDLQDIGLCLSHEYGRMVVRFCVFSDSKPEFKAFTFRFNTKAFRQYPVADPPVTRTGCSLNKIKFQVFDSTKVGVHDIVQAMGEVDGWDWMASWINDALTADGFSLCMPDHVFPEFLPGIFVGVGIEKPESNIQFPPAIAKSKSKIQAQPKAYVPADDDGEFDDEGDDA
jgi:hypothetical protein